MRALQGGKDPRPGNRRVLGKSGGQSHNDTAMIGRETIKRKNRGRATSCDRVGNQPVIAARGKARRIVPRGGVPGRADAACSRLDTQVREHITQGTGCQGVRRRPPVTVKTPTYQPSGQGGPSENVCGGPVDQFSRLLQALIRPGRTVRTRIQKS